MAEELTLQDLRRMGGQATFKKYGAEHYKKMNQKSIEARRKNNSVPKNDKNTT